MELPTSVKDDKSLIMVARCKQYILKASGLRTAKPVTDELSNIIRILLHRAMGFAEADDRKTVMEADIKKAFGV